MAPGWDGAEGCRRVEGLRRVRPRGEESVVVGVVDVEVEVCEEAEGGRGGRGGEGWSSVLFLRGPYVGRCPDGADEGNGDGEGDARRSTGAMSRCNCVRPSLLSFSRIARP